jgi:hypothetical protein
MGELDTVHTHTAHRTPHTAQFFFNQGSTQSAARMCEGLLMLDTVHTRHMYMYAYKEGSGQPSNNSFLYFTTSTSFASALLVPRILT